jgi:HSP20 family protein
MGASLRPLFRGFRLPASRPDFDALLGDVFAPLGRDWDRWFAAAAGSPRLNVWEDGDVFYAEAEIAGVKSEDLDLSVVGKELTIKGRRVAPTDGAPSNATASPEAVTFHRRERGYGEFTRSVTLPVEIDAAQVSASLVNGVLTVKLPKAEAAKPRKINVAQS